MLAIGNATDSTARKMARQPVSESDSVYRGVARAAAAVGQPPARIQMLISHGFLQTRRGESGARGGRPAHLIRRADLLEAIRRYDAWQAEKPREKPAPPLHSPPPRRTRLTKQRKKLLRKLRRQFHPHKPLPRKFKRNRLSK